MKRLTERAKGDRGAVLVEFAIVFPIFIALIFAFAEFTMAEAGNSAGGNAARDGARVGIINFADADQAASANFNLISAAVNSKLAGLVRGSPVVSVTCVKSDGTTELPNKCDPANVHIGSDMIKVQVQWRQITALGFTSTSPRSDQAVMKIVGSPGSSGTGGTSGACTLTNPTASPSPVDAIGGVLANPITFTVRVSSAADCGTPQLSLPSESGLPAVVNMFLQTSSTTVYQYVYPNDYPPTDQVPPPPPPVQAWTAGTKTAQMQVQAGLKTTSTSFAVTASTPCTFGTVTPNPTVNVTLQNNRNFVKSNYSVKISLPVNDSTASATPMLSVSGVTSPLNTPRAMTPNGSKYELTISGSENDQPWSAGTGTINITGPGGASTSVGINVS